MLSINSKMISLVMSLLVMTGCGGGGGGSGGSSESAAETTPQAVEDSVQIEATNIIESNMQSTVKMSELIASSDFAFTNKINIDVSIDLMTVLVTNNQLGERAYLSIYRDYSALPSGTFYPDSSSRVLAGALSNGVFNQSFVALTNQSSYLMEVWFYNGDEPIQEELILIGNDLTN